jgi:sialic acid synthase SpsE
MPSLITFLSLIEIPANHGGSFERAKQMVHDAINAVT